MKVRDSQFAKYFLTNEINLNQNVVNNILELDIEIVNGEPDNMVQDNRKLICSSPSSLTRFLFNIIYAPLSKIFNDDLIVQRDKLGLGLLYMCRNYVYSDSASNSIPSTVCPTIGPPVIISVDKIPVPRFIVREIVEPLIGKIGDIQVVYAPCKCTDACRIITDLSKFRKQYSFSASELRSEDLPILLCNTSVRNAAAELSHITVKCLEMTLGRDKANKLIRNMLLDEDARLIHDIITILKILRGDPEFVVDFLKYFESSIEMDEKDQEMSSKIQYETIQRDSYLDKHIKSAGDSYNPQVHKQWSQWSMLMGLIEKQLTPMRGSMWPTTENMRPFDDARRKMYVEKAKENNKNQLNYEELLEVARDTYDHNAVEPGKLIEFMLKDNRVW